jgi:molybdenum cofactor sulfurtransferase
VVPGKWDSFWREETNALVAAGAVESEIGLVTALTTEAKKKEKEKEKEISGLRKVARALALSRRHAWWFVGGVSFVLDCLSHIMLYG